MVGSSLERKTLASSLPLENSYLSGPDAQGLPHPCPVKSIKKSRETRAGGRLSRSDLVSRHFSPADRAQP